MAKAHDRVVELLLTMNAAADTVTVTGVNYYREGGSAAYALKFTSGAAQTSPSEIFLGELLPPPTLIRFTFSAF